MFSAVARTAFKKQHARIVAGVYRRLHELRQIDLRGTPLAHLPAAIAALPRLEKLDLRWVNLPAPTWLLTLEARGCLVYR
jgi:hypothetical protein